jgi:gluconate kinase
MRDAHLQNILKRIEDLKQQSEQIAVCGAFFKEHHRRLLSERFPDAVWLWVDTLPQLQRQRLLHRQNHLANLDYAEKIFSEFEPPQNHIIKLENNAGRIGIVQQFQKLLTLYDPS